MHELAEGVHHLPLAPRDGINAYLLGDVLVDAGIKPGSGRLVRALRERPVAAHALTHAHPDHAGGSKAVADAFDVPVWAGARDARAVRDGQTEPAVKALAPLGRFPAVEVARELREGDELGHGFVVLDTPGHSPGHVSFWRETDRVLVCGDVLFRMSLLTTRPTLRQPPGPLTVDPERNRASIRRVAELRPALVLVGHGPPLRDPDALAAFARHL